MLWLPWAALGLASAASWLLAASLATATLGARQTLDRNASKVAALFAISPSLPAVGPGSGPVGTASEADEAAMEAAVTALLVDPPDLLERVETLAAASGVTLAQFVPEPADGKAAGTLPTLRLQVGGPAERVESFLTGLGGSGLAIELSSLRLAAGRVPGEILCDAALRLHDEDSLARLAAVFPSAAPRSLDAIALIPGGVFGPSGLAGTTLTSTAAGRVDLADSIAHVPPADPLAGIRLTGIFRQGDRVAALIDIPGEGPALLRPADPLGQTRFRLESASAGRVVIVDGSGDRRTLELDTTPAGAP